MYQQTTSEKGPTRKLNPDRRVIDVSSSLFGKSRRQSEHKQNGAAKVKSLRAKAIAKALQDDKNFDAAQIWPTRVRKTKAHG